MSLYSDYVAFVDDGSLVPYHVVNAFYVVRHKTYTGFFEYEMKQFYISGRRYYVGVDCSQLVREILPSDYHAVRALHLKKSESLINKSLQLTFDF